MLVRDFDLLHFVAPVTFTMLTELSGKNCEADLCLLDVGSSDLNEDVAGVERDFCLLRVDDGR